MEFLKLIKKSISYTLVILYKYVTKFYIFLFARPSMQKVNDKLLNLALQGRGYNIQVNEQFVISNILSKFDPKLCLDIGANIGNFSKMILEYTNSNVIAFEPLPSAYSKLATLEKTHKQRFKCFNLGVGNKQEQMKIYFGENTELSTFSHESLNIDYIKNNNSSIMSAKITTLDKFFEDYEPKITQLDFIKIDTEGFEFKVLQGAEKIILRFKPKFIQIEFNWHHLFLSETFYALTKLLPEYKIYQILSNGTVLSKRDAAMPESNIFHFSNFLFVHNNVKFDWLE